MSRAGISTIEPPHHSVPPLENGDRLTRPEFERRYAAMPHIPKAEVIERIVYVTERVPMTRHGRPHAILTGCLGRYIAFTPGLKEFGSNTSVRLDWDNEFQPDVFLNLPKHIGGLAEPTLACEIASSSVSIDLHAKLNAYRRNQVQEYLVWRTDDQAVDWFIWREGEYDRLPQDENGAIKSRHFPGLWLHVPSLLEGNLPSLFKVVDEGAATAEHREFVERLK